MQIRVEDDEKVLKKQDQFEYRSGVGSLLYLLKHSRPELSNPIRELSRCMDRPSEENRKEMYRVIKWVIDHPFVGWRCDPRVEKKKNGEVIWSLSGICDATWGSSKQDGRSVSRYIVYLQGVPIAWRSKCQPHCSLSSSESEYVAISELVRETQIAQQVLSDMGISL